jgi:hypothetical protein
LVAWAECGSGDGDRIQTVICRLAIKNDAAGFGFEFAQLPPSASNLPPHGKARIVSSDWTRVRVHQRLYFQNTTTVGVVNSIIRMLFRCVNLVIPGKPLSFQVRFKQLLRTYPGWSPPTKHFGSLGSVPARSKGAPREAEAEKENRICIAIA